ELDALDGIATLLDNSLIRQDDEGGEPRFELLETIHEFARERLEESGEAEVVGERHAAYFLQVAEEAAPRLRGPEQASQLRILAPEQENVRAALSWFLDRRRGAEAIRLGTALAPLWEAHGSFAEARAWLERGLSCDDESD